MQHLAGLLEDLNIQHGRLKNRLQNRLQALHYSVAQNRFTRERLEAGLTHVEEEIKAVEKELAGFVREHEKDTFECLTSIPGIGPKRAILLIVRTESMKGFDTAKQLSSYLGLCPRIIDSGTSVKGKTGICRMGMSMIRKLLYLCALSAKKYNRVCRKLYERLLTQGKTKKPALIAVANKLLKQAFSMVKNHTKYEDDFCAKKKMAC